MSFHISCINVSPFSPTSPPKTTHAAEKTDEEKIDIEAEDFPFFVAILVCFIWIAIGAMFFSLWEKWNYGVALYFMYQSLTTIGLGILGLFLLLFQMIFRRHHANTPCLSSNRLHNSHHRSLPREHVP